MKKLIAIIIVISSLMGISVKSNAQFRYGPVVGVTLNDFIFKQDLVSVSKQVGGMAGIQAEMMFPGIGIGIDLGLLYNQQSAKVNLGQKPIWSWHGWGNEHVMLHNILIPLHLRFKYTRLGGLEEKIAPIVFGGPEFDIQVGHSNAGAFKCSGGDLGLVAGVGAELFRNWQVTASYTWGMTYICRTKLLDDYSARSRQWTLKVAYLF